MRVAHLLHAAGLAGATLLLACPTATAIEGGDVMVKPTSAKPKQQVTVTATGCITDNANAVARAYSDAFATIALEAVPGTEPGVVSGKAKVFAGAKPGTYQVNVPCDVTKGVSATGSLTVTR
ncbi:hypothetical protein [Streptomyces sp. 184]|uniref:hypothetical protein n=1 Tax=Streptomyces sp. 184 TaxID=1827526 RepID=UPI003891761F